MSFFNFRYDSHPSKMLSNLKNIVVNATFCVENCGKSCSDLNCELCVPCLSDENQQNLHRAYREHGNRGGFKRIFPAQKQFNEGSIETTANNRVSLKWFEAKCHEDPEWC